jgi:hypothetical protein
VNPAKKAMRRVDIVILFLLAGWRQVICRTIWFHGSSLPIRAHSAISPNFIARLIKGCRGDVPAGRFRLGNNPALSTL